MEEILWNFYEKTRKNLGIWRKKANGRFFSFFVNKCLPWNIRALAVFSMWRCFLSTRPFYWGVPTHEVWCTIPLEEKNLFTDVNSVSLSDHTVFTSRSIEPGTSGRHYVLHAVDVYVVNWIYNLRARRQ